MFFYACDFYFRIGSYNSNQSVWFGNGVKEMNKIERVIVTVGVAARRVKRLSLYVDLLEKQCTDKWTVSDGGKKSDIVFLDASFYQKHLVKNVDPELTIYCYDDKIFHPEFTNALRYPFTADQLLKVLNRMSHSGKLPTADDVKQPAEKKNFFKKISELEIFPKRTPKPTEMEITENKSEPPVEVQHNIILLGGPGSGKDVALKSILQDDNGATQSSAVVSHLPKDAQGNDQAVVEIKQKHAVKVITPPDEIKPGYNWNTTVQSQHIDSYIIFLNLRNFDPIQELQHYLNLITLEVAQVAAVCCALVYYDDTHHSFEKIRQQIYEHTATDISIVRIDPRKKINVLNVLIRMVNKVKKKQRDDRA